MKDLRASDFAEGDNLPAVAVLLAAARAGLTLDADAVEALRPGADALARLGIVIQLEPGEPLLEPAVLFEPFQQFDTTVLAEGLALANAQPAFSGLYQAETHETAQTHWRVPVQPDRWPPQRIARDPTEPGLLYFADGCGVVTTCMKCHPAPCVTYLPDEYALGEWEEKGIPNDKAEQVCPTLAIEPGPERLPVINQDLCVHCQVCVVRCPVGALYWQDNALTVASALSAEVEERTGPGEQAEADTAAWTIPLRTETVQFWSMSTGWVLETVREFQNLVAAKARTREEYYPLVRNLLRELDLKAVLGRKGDTVWRFDCVVLEPFFMAAEIKSSGEATKIPVRSIRQALENAAIVINRFALSPNPINFVIGHELPPKRSDVSKALADIEAAFKAGIGVYTAGTLFYLFLRHQVFHFHATLDLEPSFRGTVGVCDDSTLRGFWADYFKRRLEIVALGDGRPTSVELSAHLPSGMSIDALSPEELMDLWRVEGALVDDLTPELFP